MVKHVHTSQNQILTALSKVRCLRLVDIIDILQKIKMKIEKEKT